MAGDTVEAATAPLEIDEYADVLTDYLSNGGEAPLYRASLLSRRFVETRTGPDEIVALHVEALQRATDGLAPRQMLLAASDALQFLLEVMIAYGVQHQEYLEMRLNQIAEAEMTKQDVITAVAHELRTPLTAARGSIDLARRKLEAGQPDEVPPLLGHSRDALDRLVRLTADLIDASREGQPGLAREPQPLAATLQRTCAWAIAAAAEKNVTLVLAPVAADLVVLGDGEALQSVFGNLVSNAIRYTPSGGVVDVCARAEGERTVIEVRDTGIGMTPEVQARVFEKFYRAPEVQLAVPQGLGLGLALVRQLVEAHDGRVELESAPGLGSTFRVSLPRA